MQCLKNKVKKDLDKKKSRFTFVTRFLLEVQVTIFQVKK